MTHRVVKTELDYYCRVASLKVEGSNVIIPEKVIRKAIENGQSYVTYNGTHERPIVICTLTIGRRYLQAKPNNPGASLKDLAIPTAEPA
jgi:hypothetical protein